MSSASPDYLDLLLSNLSRGNGVLFWGADEALDYPAAPLSRPQLAAALAQQRGFEPGLSWLRVVELCQAQDAGSPKGVIDFLRRQSAGWQPGPLHHAIARSGLRIIVSAWYDDLLENALQQAGRRVHPVLIDTDMNYTDEEDRVIVVKLYGGLANADTLALDRWEHDALLQDSPDHRLMNTFIILCRVRYASLCIGFDLENPLLRQLHWQASRGNEQHLRPMFATASPVRPELPAAWQGKGIHLIQAPPLALFERMVQAQAQASSPAALARGLLQRAVENWRSAGLLIPLEALALLDDQAAGLSPLDAASLELLLRSALASGARLEGWAALAQQAGLDVGQLARKELAAAGEAAFRSRTGALRLLRLLDKTDPQPFIDCLADPYPQVRREAILALEGLQPGGEWRAHLQYECYVPGGVFRMGDAEKEEEHQMHLDSFYIG